jgi:L-ascorbate metabolism protein UlaG (beta-lactamase superfamily)
MRADVTYLGHSTVLVVMGDTRILTDPVLYDRVTILRRAVSPLPANLYADIDGVVISHLHHDHLDLPSLRLLGQAVPLVVPRGARGFLARHGFANVTELSPGDQAEIGSVRVTATPARHSGYRLPLGPRAEAIGYLLDEGTERVYFAGDTDRFDEMAGLHDIDLALLPVWGWGPRLGSGHMDPARAAEALRLLRPTAAVPIHWGTLWPLGLGRVTPHRLQQPPLEFARRAALAAPDVLVYTTPPGQTVPIPREAAKKGKGE